MNMTPPGAAFVDDPPSHAIAAKLNASDTDECEHGRDPCYLRCGVRRRGGINRDASNNIASVGSASGRWEPIPKGRRLEWLAGEGD